MSIRAPQGYTEASGIREKFSYQVSKKPALDIEYLVYCPDHAVKRISAAGLDRERIVDASQNQQLAARIQTVLPPGPTDIGGWAQQVHRFFRQTFEVVPDVHAHIDAQERNYTRLSHCLLEVLDFEGDWSEAARLFLRKGAGILWLEDPSQNVRDTDAIALRHQGFAGYRSLLNHHSPELIARFISQVLPKFSFTCADDLPDLGVGVKPYEAPIYVREKTTDPSLTLPEAPETLPWELPAESACPTYQGPS